MVPLESIWQEFLTIMRAELGSRVVETWLKSATLKQWDALNKRIFIQAPNKFVLDWISSRYVSHIQEHLGRLLNVDRLEIILSDGGTPAKESLQGVPHKEHAKESMLTHPLSAGIIESPHKDDTASSARPIIPRFAHKTTSTHLVKAAPAQKGLLSNYTFSHFVVGPSNSLAYAAARAVSEQPGLVYNPLFIYGGSGLGKTHLLHAIGNEIAQRHPQLAIVYQTTDRFLHEFITAIRFDKMHHFREKYKEVDVLLIDDMQFISHKGQTQEAFFHIFNSLHELGKQMVFTSDTYPSDIAGIAERLRSRLEWGLVTDIHVPPLETKIAILKRKAELSQEAIPHEVIEYIAERDISNIRDLESSFIRVVAFASLTKQVVTLDVAKKVLMRTSQSTAAPKELKLEDIARAVAQHFSISFTDLSSPSRSKDIVLARQVAMYMGKRMTNKSLMDIGSIMNRKDHSTVAHAISRVTQMRETDSAFDQRMRQLERELNNL